jgi:hypothetical protein
VICWIIIMFQFTTCPQKVAKIVFSGFILQGPKVVLKAVRSFSIMEEASPPAPPPAPPVELLLLLLLLAGALLELLVAFMAVW